MSSQSLLHNAMNPSGSHAFQGLSHFAGFTPPPPCGPAVPDLHPEGFHGVERAPTPPADWDNTTRPESHSDQSVVELMQKISDTLAKLVKSHAKALRNLRSLKRWNGGLERLEKRSGDLHVETVGLTQNARTMNNELDRLDHQIQLIARPKDGDAASSEDCDGDLHAEDDAHSSAHKSAAGSGVIVYSIAEDIRSAVHLRGRLVQ